MAQPQFGSGVAYITPLSIADGSVLATPTPLKVGVLQNISLDYSGDVKELFGQYAMPVSVARGKMKVSGKAQFASFNTTLMNSLFFGQSVTSGLYGIYNDLTGDEIPASSPYTIEPTVPSSGTWAEDLGVISATGFPLTRVASSPSTGQYTVSDGTYTFASADAGALVYINFSYTTTTTTARKLEISNVLMGAAPTFQLDLYQTFNGKQMTIKLFSCVSTKLSLATKLDDYGMADFDFSVFANDAGKIGRISTTDR